MPLNINKGGKLGKYYYSKGGVEYGPIELGELLEHIDKDTLVYFEGIKWTNASQIPELKRYFVQEKVVEKVVERVVVKEPEASPLKKPSKTPYVLMLLLIAVLGGWFYLHQKQLHEEHQKELEQLAENDSLNNINGQIALQNEQRLRDSVAIASAALLDSARLLKLTMDYQLNVGKALDVIKAFHTIMEKKQYDFRAVVTDTVLYFRELANITPYDLARYFSTANKLDPNSFEYFEVDEPTLKFEMMDGEFGFYTFLMKYNKVDKESMQMTQNDSISVRVRMSPDFRINAYYWNEITPIE